MKLAGAKAKKIYEDKNNKKQYSLTKPMPNKTTPLTTSRQTK